MRFSSQRGADPFRCEVSVLVEDEDIAAAFKTNENAELFYSFLQARVLWDQLAVSTRLRIVADVVELAEQERAKQEKAAPK